MTSPPKSFARNHAHYFATSRARFERVWPEPSALDAANAPAARHELHAPAMNGRNTVVASPRGAHFAAEAHHTAPNLRIKTKNNKKKVKLRGREARVRRGRSSEGLACTTLAKACFNFFKNGPLLRNRHGIREQLPGRRGRQQARQQNTWIHFGATQTLTLGTFAACWRTATAAQALTNTPPFSLASATTSDVSLHAQRCNSAVASLTR